MSGNELAGRRFLPVLLSQALAALGDNILRNALAVMVLWGGAAGRADWMVAAAAAAFVAPTVLLSGLGGELADRMDKGRLFRLLRLAELPVAALAAFGLAADRPGLVLLALGAAGMVSALFGPVKYAILPDRLPAERLPAANALVEAATFAAIIAGSVAGGLLFGAHVPGTAPGAAAGLAALGAGVLSCAAAFLIPPGQAGAPGLRLRANLLASTAELVRDLRADRPSWRAAGANAWFWAAGAAVLSLLPGLVRDALDGGPGTETAVLACFALGLGVGSLLASFLAGGRIVLLTAALGSALLGASLITAALLAGFGPAMTGAVMLVLGLAAVGAGLIAVPSLAAVQAWAPPARRARVVGATNVLSAAAMAAVAGLLGLAQFAGAAATALLGVVGLASLLLAPVMARRLTARPLAEACWLLLRLFFRIELRGAAHLRGEERAVICPNHVSWLDAAALYAVAEGPVLFVIDAGVARFRWVRPFLRVVPAVPVEAGNPHALRRLVAAVAGGGRLVIFPEGRITVSGSLMDVQDGPGTIADKADAPVIPVRIEGLERSFWSRLDRAQARRAFFPKAVITVLPPRRLAVDPGLVGRARRDALTAALRDAMEDAVFRTAETGTTLTEAVGRAAQRHGTGRTALEDPLAGPLSYRRVLAGADALGRVLTEGTAPGERVGLLLPTATATALALLGLCSFGRVPAMLNATAGLAALRACCAAAELRTVVTSRAFVDKARLGKVAEALGGELRLVFLEDLRPRINRGARLRALARAFLAPARPRLRGRDPDGPAVVMFTSGSSGTPKGVVLSHRNLLANVAQVRARIGFGRDDRLLAALPLFHAFGLTAGLVLPLLEGLPAFLYPSPLHYAAVPAVAYNWNATAMFGTSTFLSGYARKAKPMAFRSLRLVVAGAERLKPAVREEWAQRFGLRVLEGYGATECSPVVALNTPASNRIGTIGRLLPGMAMRIEPEPGIEDAGRLVVSGPNVMLGYLKADRPGALQPPPDGWYDTGDLVSVGGDGHLTIRGRLSRTAKLGGEMVSLEVVEAIAADLWPNAVSVAVSVPDERKGERVVLVTDQVAARRADFAARARASGAAEVTTPAEIRVVRKVPMLGSGKPDLRAAAALAGEGAAAPAPEVGA